MTEADLYLQLTQGEDSRHQFKSNVANIDSLAAELAAFANSGGGTLFIGVNDNGSIAGLSKTDIRRLNQLLSNAASQHVRPPLHPLTENVSTDQGIVMVVNVPDGLSKPYLDAQGRLWVKQGADKRHVTSREEMQRMFQRSGLVRADQVPVAGSSSADLDVQAFAAYFQRRYQQSLDSAGATLDQLLHNIGLGDGRELNLSGMMLFGNNPLRWCPAFTIKAVAFPGTVIWDSRYLDSEDFSGTPPVAPPVTPPVAALLKLVALTGELGNADIRRHLKLADRTHVREHYIGPALKQGLIEYTIPDKPRSRLQKYRITAAGKALVESLEKGEGN